jgi:hypothetical protein
MENTVSSLNGNFNKQPNNSTPDKNAQGFANKLKHIVDNIPFRKKKVDKPKVARIKKEWGPDWTAYSKTEKIKFILYSIIKSILAVLCLYLFLLSLNFMSVGFTMVK